MEPTQQITGLLGGVPIFAGLNSHDLEVLSQSARRQGFKPDEVICQQGDPGHTLFVIVSGLVRILLPSFEGQEAVLVLLQPGEFFGELSLIDGEPRSASAVSMGATEVIVLYRDDFQSFLLEHPRAAITVMTVLCSRLRHTDDVVADAVFLDTRTRLAKKLLELSETFGEKVDDGVQIALRLRQQDLANMVGANRESVNRYLSAMENQGLIRMERQRITLLKPQELRGRSV